MSLVENVKRCMREHGEQCAEIERLTTWQPIWTAPNDGTHILLWDTRNECAVSGRWHIEAAYENPSEGHIDGWSGWRADNDIIPWDDGFYIPSHWMPFPGPPGDNRLLATIGK